MSIESSYVPNQNDEISLKELISKIREWWRYLLSKSYIILIFGLLGSVLGLWYAFNQKVIYIATTNFVLEEDKGSGGIGGSLAGIAAMAGVDLNAGGGGIFQGDNILQLYKSRTMIEKTLLTQVEIQGKKELLINRYIDFNKYREKWEKDPVLKSVRFTASDSTQLISHFSRLQDSIIGSFIKNINDVNLIVGRPDKKLSIIEVTVLATDEEFAKAFNDEIVKHVNQFYKDTKTKKSLQNVTILQAKTDSVRNVMNGAIYSAARIADATPNMNPTRQAQRGAPIQQAQFSAESNRAMYATLVQNLELAKIALTKETPLLEIVDHPILPLEKKKFGKLKGVILGGLLFGFLAVAFLSLKLMFKNILNDE